MIQETLELNTNTKANAKILLSLHLTHIVTVETNGRACSVATVRYGTESVPISIKLVLSTCLNTSKTTPRTHSDFTTEYKIISYIDQHFHEDLTVEKIAEHFNISTSTLMHIFNEYTNRSVYDYVLYRRIVKAKELISVGLPLSTVATSCGFNDYSNFLRIFKKRMGISPRAYQKQFSETNTVE